MSVLDNQFNQPNTDINVNAAKYRNKWRISFLVFGIVCLVSFLSIWYVGMLDPYRWRKAVLAFLDLAWRMMPPDFSDWKSWIDPLFNSMSMSMSGTALAVMAAIPLGMLAAKNASPHPAIYRITRIALNFMRGVPDLIAAITFVGALGMGPLAGTLALGFHSAGVLGKFFAEIVEHTDNASVEAVRATGASPLQVLYHGYLALAIPQLADAAVYRWECNFRNSVMLGMVGAGGIGFQIYAAYSLLKYQEVMALLIVVLVLVTLADILGSMLRQQVK